MSKHGAQLTDEYAKLYGHLIWLNSRFWLLGITKVIPLFTDTWNYTCIYQHCYIVQYLVRQSFGVISAAEHPYGNTNFSINLAHQRNLLIVV